MDMSDKTVLVTGATSGIGYETARQLAQSGARVLVHGRNKVRATAAVEAIAEALPDTDLVPVSGDFSSMDEVRRLVEQVTRKTDRLEVLIHNAGVYMPQYAETVDGLEMTFEVNHLAAFAITALLDDLLSRSAPARIITVSSVAHFRGELHLEDDEPRRPYDGYEAYAASKLANVLFAVEAAARFSGSGVTSNTLHPGVTDTKLLHVGFPDQHGAHVSVGAATPVYLASSPDIEDVTGRYFVNQHSALMTPLADDLALRTKLWRASDRLAGVAAR